MQEAARSTEEPTSYLASFPFWVYVARSADSPVIHELEYRGSHLRVYPPFRSGPANLLPMPYINGCEVPFQGSARPEISPDFSPMALAVIPTLGVDESHGASLLTVWGEEWDDPPDPFPMNSLRIDVLTAPRDSAGEVARSLLDSLLSQIRVTTRQWWICHSVHPLVGYVRNEFAITVDGRPCEQPAGLGQGRTVTGNERPLTESSWLTVLTEVAHEVQVPLHQELYLDGRYFTAAHDYRRAVVDFAIACEHAKEQTFERLYIEASSGRAEYRRSRILTGHNLPRHLSGSLRRFGQSYEDEHPEQFRALEDLWHARGNVAHGRAPSFRRGGAVYHVDEGECKRFAAAVDHCIRWLGELTVATGNNA